MRATGGAMTQLPLTQPSNWLALLGVKIRNAYGNDLITLETLNDGSTANTWIFSGFDVNAYIGQSVQVYYRGTTDSSYKTNFFIDDVNLSVCEGG
jgi:hypothetical protein